MLVLTPNALDALMYCTGGLVIFYLLSFGIGFALRRSAVKGHAKIEPQMRDIIRRKERADAAALAKQQKEKEKEDAKKVEKKPPRSDPPPAPKKPPKDDEMSKAKSAANTVSRDSAEPTVSEIARRFPRHKDPVFVINYNTEGHLLKSAPNMAKTDDGKVRERQRKWKTDNEFLAAIKTRGDLEQCEKKPTVLECK